MSVSSDYTVNASGSVLTSGVVTNTSINAASLITVGAISRNGSVGNVTNATLNTVRASLSGNTLSIGSGLNEGVANASNTFNATNDSAGLGANETKNVKAATATPTQLYSYLTYGRWHECGTSCNTTNEAGVTGAFVYGLATDPAVIMLKSGTATYTGNIRGIYIDAAGAVSEKTEANLISTANFSARTVSFTTSSSTTQTNNVSPIVANPGLNMTGNLSYSAGSNQFTGPVTATGLSGTATGKFFGPAAQEIGGVYTLRGTAGGHDGVFVGK